MTTATKITLIRVAILPVYMVLMYLSGGVSGAYMWWALAVFIIASLTDLIDGEIARKYHQISDFGKFLDPLADKLLVVAAMLMFCQWGSFPAWALMLVLTREFAVTGLRLMAVGKGKVIAAGWSGKVKTACTMVGLCVMMVPPVANLAIAGSFTVNTLMWIVILVTTVVSGVEYFAKNGSVLVKGDI